ncbi:MAG TPA: glycosyltransferase family 39 protein [Polyangiaceae bacterium]
MSDQPHAGSGGAAERARRFATWLRGESAEIAVAASVLVFALVVRLSTLEGIEIGGDAVIKWHFARQWFHHFDLHDVQWDHHRSRLGVIVPVVLIQALFGHGAAVYHVAALLCSTTLVCVVYAAGRLAHGRTVGVLSAVWFALFPSWVRTGSQVTPDGFGALYVGVALCLLLAYARSERHKQAFLLASAAFSGFAYLAKEPLVFFAPGALAATYLLGRRVRDVLVYAGVLLALLGVETLFYRAVSDFSSRLAIVSRSHGDGPGAALKGFGELFERYAHLPDFWYVLLIPAALGAIGLPLLTRDRRLHALICFPVSFFFCYTFAIRRLDPLSMWTRFLARYLDPGAPFAMLVATSFVVVGTTVLARRFVPAAGALAARALRFEPVALTALLLVLALTRVGRAAKDGSFAETRNLERNLSTAYERGVPVLATGRSGYKALRAAYMVYIDDELLLDSSGKLPWFSTEVRFSGRLVRPGAPARAEDCKVEVSLANRWLKLNRRELGRGDCR